MAHALKSLMCCLSINMCAYPVVMFVGKSGRSHTIVTQMQVRHGKSEIHLQVAVLVFKDVLNKVDGAKSCGLWADQRATVCQSEQSKQHFRLSPGVLGYSVHNLAWLTETARHWDITTVKGSE